MSVLRRIPLFLILLGLAAEEPAPWWYIATGNAAAPPVPLSPAAVLLATDDRTLILLSLSGTPLRTTTLPARPHTLLASPPHGPLYLLLRPHTLLALTPAGTPLWTLALHPPHPPAVLPSGTLYALTAPRTLARITPTGRTLWRRTLPADPVLPPVATAGGPLYLALPDTLIALTPGGRTLFRIPLEASPLALVPTPRTGPLLLTARSLTQFDPTGTPLWTRPLTPGAAPALRTAPGHIAVITQDSTIHRFDADGTPLGRHTLRTPIAPSLTALAADGTLLLATRDGRILALAPDHTLTDLTPAPPIPYRGTPLHLLLTEQGRILLTTSDWLLYALPTPLRPSPLWAHERGPAAGTASLTRGPAIPPWWEDDPRYRTLRRLATSSDVEDNLRALSLIERLLEGDRTLETLDYLIPLLQELALGGMGDPRTTCTHSPVRARAYLLLARTGDPAALPRILSGLSYETLPEPVEALLAAVAAFPLDPDGTLTDRLETLLHRLPRTTLTAVLDEFVGALSRIVEYNRGREGVEKAMRLAHQLATGPYPAAVRRAALDILTHQEKEAP
ncbi:PQQ-binding-like beta-propeller repeat protein [Spirochaeta thermophila]|nr:PQQ-binding-like beta-propeller repeat protein [Spirochaeta thermophila]